MKTEKDVEAEILPYVSSFLQARESDITKIRQSLDSNDLKTVERICHNIKGVAKPYGFPSLEDISRKLEFACKHGDNSSARLVFGEMQEYLRKFLH